MPPSVALLLCILFIFFLFKMDSKRESKVSHALWIPWIWLLIIGSRPVALWLNSGDVLETEMDIISGNPIDRAIFSIIIVIGLIILFRRKAYLLSILKSNAWIIFLISFYGISTSWSEFPFVSFKRWIKEIGSLIMVLIVVTDDNPVEAMKTLLRRCAYVLVPLSIVLIKYYPDLSRSYHPWTGVAANSGVGTSKNALGILCLVLGLFFLWNILTLIRKKIPIDKKEVFVNILFLVMIVWLFIKANSVTSLVAFITGICTILGLSLIKNNVRYVGFYIFSVIFIFLILQLSFGIIESSVLNFGRDMTLTGRTDLWKDVLNMVTNPFVGTGFESFWLGERMTKLWEIHWWRPNQAHNGYIETYLNLGLAGLFLLTGVILSSYRKIRRTLIFDFDYGRFRMAFFVIALIYNITEAAFRAVSIMWFIFLIIAMDVPRFSQEQQEVKEPVRL